MEDRDYRRAEKCGNGDEDSTVKRIFLGMTDASRQHWNTQCSYRHDKYGMKYGWNGNDAFLRVVRLDDPKQKKRFEAEYEALAQSTLAGAPMIRTRLPETMQAQYQQLLWDFVFQGYDEFASSAAE